MIHDLIIKPVTRKEISHLTAFIHTLLDEDFPGHYKLETINAYKKVYSEKHFRKIYRGKHIVLGAYISGELIGIYITVVQTGGVGYIDWLGVKKKYRRNSIASLLITEGEKYALRLHLHYLWLYTMSQNNINFYQKRGYKNIGAHHNGWFGETDYILEKTISPSLFEDVFQVSD